MHFIKQPEVTRLFQDVRSGGSPPTRPTLQGHPPNVVPQVSMVTGHQPPMCVRLSMNVSRTRYSSRTRLLSPKWLGPKPSFCDTTPLKYECSTALHTRRCPMSLKTLRDIHAHNNIIQPLRGSVPEQYLPSRNYSTWGVFEPGYRRSHCNRTRTP